MEEKYKKDGRAVHIQYTLSNIKKTIIQMNYTKRNDKTSVNSNIPFETLSIW